jgi:formylglycine-generating enzyme
MAGNVLEWVADFYDTSYYAASPALNPAGPASGDFHVVRGGCWGNEAQYLRVASRIKASPDFSSNSVGFRCAR